MGLTKEQIKTLRNADDLCFRYDPSDDPKHQIVAFKGYDPGDGFRRRQIAQTVAASDLSTINDYGYQKGVLKNISRAVHASYTGANREWVTIAESLREGDELRILWTLHNDSEVIAAAGLTHHELRVAVVRQPNPDRPARTFTYLVDSWVDKLSHAFLAVERTRG